MQLVEDEWTRELEMTLLEGLNDSRDFMADLFVILPFWVSPHWLGSKWSNLLVLLIISVQNLCFNAERNQRKEGNETP